MKNKILIYILIFVLSYNMYAANNDSKVIANIGKYPLTFGELEKAYKKNINRKSDNLAELPADTVLSFLELYANYKLKVLDALDRGYDKDSTVKNDIANNRKMLAESFYYDKVLIKPNVNYYTHYRDYEYQIAYIIISGNNIDGVSNEEAEKKANEALARIKKGEDFGAIALEYSSDKESAKKGGIIDQYITSGRMQRPLEKALLTLNPGQVYKDVVVTPYGHFILKMIKKEPRKMVMPAHILVAEDGVLDSVGIKKKADSVYKALKSGADFVRTAEEISNDPATAIRGGKFEDYYSRSYGFIKSGQPMVPEFVNTLYSLKHGEISSPIKTDYGYHIIKRIETKDFDKEAEMKEINTMYKRMYFEADKRAFLDSAAFANGLVIEWKNLKEMLSELDTSKSNLTKNWIDTLNKDTQKKTLFSFQKKNYSIANYYDLTTQTSKLRGMSLNTEGIVNSIHKFVDDDLFNILTKNLEKDNEEFARLMSEFYDGILLFKVENEEVWEKIKQFDSVNARKYWEENKTKYKTDVLWDLSEIYVLSDTLANELYARIQKGEDFAKLAASNTQREGYREKSGSWGEVSSKRNKFLNFLGGREVKDGMVLEPKKFERGHSIIKINKVLPPRMKTFEEAIGDFASAFQDIRQKQITATWLSKVKEKHKLDIKKDVIKQICK